MPTPSKIALLPGVYAATLTFFDEAEGLDVPTLRRHISRLAKAGLSGIVTLGSNGEAVHLTDDERKIVTRTTRETLHEEGYSHLPVIVGSSAQSVRGTIKLCRDAYDAGGSHVLVLPPSYYKAAMTPDAIYDFYMHVADASPLPVVLYSFPAVTSNINMSSDLLIRISQHLNVVGTKFTCGDTGKLGRVARAMQAAKPSQEDGYWAVGGLADMTLQALVAGGSGVIAGGANVTPKVCVRVYELFRQGRLEEAMKVQAVLSEGDWVHTAAGIGGTKAVLQNSFSYGGAPRLPLSGTPVNVAADITSRMSEVVQLEKRL